LGVKVYFIAILSPASQNDIIHPTMRSYEMMLIIRPDIDVTDTKKINTLIMKFLGPNAGFMKDMNVVGKKKLQYPIEKQLEGIYVMAKLSAERIDVSYLDKQMKMMSEIMRYLLIVLSK
jgi:small subunit ribosomal protein S6